MTDLRWPLAAVLALVMSGLGLWLNDHDDLRAEQATQLSKQDAIAAECCGKE